MKGFKLTAGLFVLALLFGLGCSSGDGGVSGDPVQSQITEPEFEALMDDVVVPPIQTLDFSFLAQGVPQASRDMACEDVSEEFCLEGGYAEICIDFLSFQINFDNQCWVQCHSTSGVVNHHHRALGDTPPPPVEAVEFGTHLTIADGDAITPAAPQPEPSTGPWPIDTDISTNATAAQPHFAVCASCPDPHGTNVNESV